jgi:hypothetical protein
MAQTLTQDDLNAIADAVWNEAYNQHKTAGTFGKLMDLLRKSNMSIEGEVTNSLTPTSIKFSTNLSGYPSSAFAHAVLLFINGSSVAEENSPIISYVATNGVITLEEPLTAAPISGDEFIIVAGSHVHSILDIAAGVRAVGVGVRATQADDGTISLYEGMTYNGTAHPKLSFTVSKNYSAATSITLSIYQPSNTTTAIKTASASAVSSTLIEVSTFAATFTPSLTYSGNPLTAELRYSLIASWAGSLETIATGPLFVYDTPPTS